MGRTTRDNDQARELLGQLRADPVLFARRILGINPWSRQREIARLLAANERVAVRSGHKVGKSTIAATLALWWAFTRPQARVLLTAPSDHQVKNILWRELRAIHGSSRVPLGGEPALDHRTGYKLAGGREVFGLTTKDQEKMAGLSSPNLLIIVDEAAGFPEHLFEVLFGNLAGGGRILLLSNPTRTSGTFFEAFHKQRERWATFHVSSFESPCVTGDEPCIPGLATPGWIDWAREYWGEGSPSYQVRVEGEFSSQADNAIIGLADVEAATQRWHDTEPPDGPLQIGVDVAYYGDDRSVIFPVRGLYAYRPVVIHGQNTTQVAGRVREVARALRRDGERVLVTVDIIGVGAGVADNLLDDPELQTIGVNVAARATDPVYANLRAQHAFALRDWLRDGGAIPPIPELEAELLAPEYKYNTRGQILVEPKEAIKSRLGRSPDLADALALAVVRPSVAEPRVEVI